MAAEKKLDVVILGLLSHEELTGYEIKKRMDTVMKYFWGAGYGSIYPTLKELVAKGLATKRAVRDSGRKKLLYTITEAGRQVLRQWLVLPAHRDELRSETLLKLFFSGEQSRTEAMQHIQTFQDKIERELPQLSAYEQTLKACLTDDAAHLYYLLTVMFGIKTYRACCEWCEEAKALLAETLPHAQETEESSC